MSKRRVILIVDDHPLVAEALELSIRHSYPTCYVGRVASATEAQEYAQAYGDSIRLVLLDLMLPDTSGFSALLALQKLLPDTPIAIISARTDSETVATARAFGVAAYLSKASPVSELVKAAGHIMDGEHLFPASEKPASNDAQAFRRKIESLSPAQLRVLQALAGGKLNKQIAADMKLTEGTVKQHLSAIFRKLDVNNRSQAILAIQPYMAADAIS